MIFRANEIYSDARFMIIAVESVDFQHSKTVAGCRCYGDIKLIAVVVCGSDGIYTLDREASQFSLEQLRQNIPSLDAMIERFDKKNN